MLKITRGRIQESRQRIINHITDIKSITPNFRVIDIGGVAGGSWSSPYIDMCVDINAGDSDTSMAFDICNWEQWSKLADHVATFGLFDYCICTHTLEDIYDPVTALRWMPRIARAGVITTPSPRTELSRHEGGYLGYIHHRWIFTEEDGKMLLVPKLSVLEGLTSGLPYNEAESEIVFEWQDTIEWRMFMNNYLGPDIRSVKDQFQNVINRG
jgi:hypothetical protein